MKKLDVKSLIIGILGTALIFVLMGSTDQDKNLGDITVNSITLKGSSDGSMIASYNEDGEMTACFGTDKGGNGCLTFFNHKGDFKGYMGENKEGDAIIILSDRNGEQKIINQE